MSERHTLMRSLHDVGLAAWFGGSLMGAVGLNGAAESEGGTRMATARIASSGWAKWTPVNAAAIGIHLFGSGGMLAADAARIAAQPGAAGATFAKALVTGAALAATAYSRVLGKQVELASSDDPEDVERAAEHPVDTEKAQRRLAYAQWAVPALTGCLVVFGALHGEQQRQVGQSAVWQRVRSMPSLCGRCSKR
ncbi:hypothetical protein LUX12_21775 [Streptomyces somaliensis]|uniref:hypothetical protein n=1 Tax=Streptomyces somaliensis TaxID=78355 RepID=UPI0020CD8284|nr:hypothetical protein [Streptomyces somaliensis]MCP9946836.1 hypothetical protein [Streptomyces somaliensis]MCP9963472.1 hypothetical protein [Streptomyces somaliensis]